MINNRHLIEPLLEFPHKEIFYFIQILQRKKDHKGTALGGSNNNSRLIKPYFITSLDKLNHQWDEMVTLANVFEARVSINLNPRNYQKAGFHLLQKVANQMSNGDFYNIRYAYNSVCGEYHAEIDKRWIVDIDTKDEQVLENIIHCINLLHTPGEGMRAPEKPKKILAVLPSKSGYHIISQSFNSDTFKRKFPDIEIHRNNPTNLYIP